MYDHPRRLAETIKYRLTVRFLPPCAGTTTTELLGLHAAGVSDEKGTVVGDQGLLELESGSGILVLGVEAGVRSVHVGMEMRRTQRRPWRWPDGGRRAGRRVHHP